VVQFEDGLEHLDRLIVRARVVALEHLVEQHGAIRRLDGLQCLLHGQPIGVDALQQDLARQRLHAERLDPLDVHDGRHFHRNVVRQTSQRAVVRDVDLELPLMVVDEGIDDGHVLFVRAR